MRKVDDGGEKNGATIKDNKLGLNWAKLRSNWNLALLKSKFNDSTKLHSK